MSQNCDYQEGVLLGNFECVCGKSSDAMSVYEKVDKNGEIIKDGYCRSGFCERKHKYIKPSELGFELVKADKKVEDQYIMSEDVAERISEIQKGDFRGWKDRRLPKDLSAFYGVQTEIDSEGKVAKRYYPCYDQQDKLTCFRVRDQKVKDAKARGEDTSKPNFFSIGKNRATDKMFGQQLFSGGGKFLIITEGEEDALAYFKAMSNNEKGYETPVVSITTGAGGATKQIKANYEWVTSFEKVFIAFDSDEPGQQATQEVARLLKPQQAYVINLRRKDACEHIKHSEDKKLRDFFWKADKYSPAGVLKLSQMWDSFEEETGKNIIPFPPAFGRLNEMMGGGMEPGEVTLIGALTGVGKGQPLWENVVTPSGYREAGSMKVGDFLIGSDGNPTKLIGVFPQGVQKCYKVTLNDGSETICDENHLWSWKTEHQSWEGGSNVTNTQGMLEYMHSGEPGGRLILPELPDNPCVNWEGRDLRIDPWLMGFLLGNNLLTLPMQFQCFEYEIVEELKIMIGMWGFEVIKDSPAEEACGTYSICIKEGHHQIANTFINLLPLYMHEGIPDDYLLGSAEQRTELIAGLFDALGFSTEGNLEYSTPSPDMADQIRLLVRSLGCTCRMIEEVSSSNERIFRLLIGNITKERGVDRNLVESVEVFTNEETVCFKVDAADELYLTNDFIVTHNSSIISHTVYNILTETDLKVGAMYLEGTKREVVRDLMSIDQRVNLKKKSREELNMPELREAFFNGVAKDDRFTFVDHQGSLSNEELINKFRYLAKAEKCNIIFVDPLQAAIASDSNSDTIHFMDSILKIAKETDCAIAVVSHMKKPSDRDPHEVNEYDLMGSSSQNQIAFNTILISRDKMNQDPKKRDSILIRIVKCRRTGETGEAGWLRYDKATSMLYATSNPYEEDEDTFSSEELALFGDSTVDKSKEPMEY